MGIIQPEFHGRDHINVFQWLDILRKGDLNYLKLFDVNLYGIDIPRNGSKRSNLMAALDFKNEIEKENLEIYVREGVELFRNFFKYSPLSFIAPCNVWNSSLEKTLHSWPEGTILCLASYLDMLTGQTTLPENAPYK